MITTHREPVMCVKYNKSFKHIITASENSVSENLIGQSHDVWRAYSLFVARVASFAPERTESANDATRDTNKLYAR